MMSVERLDVNDASRKRRVGWRPSYSVRTMVIAVSLVAIYFGCWDMTKRFGVDPPQVHGTNSIHVSDERSPIPFVIRSEKLDGGCILYRVPVYDVWLFGPRFRLPLDSWFQPNSMNDIQASWEEE